MTKGEKFFVGGIGILAIYWGYNYYQRTAAIITDTTTTPSPPSILDMSTSSYTSPDYRGQTNLPLGIQNNNPGNLRYVAGPQGAWQGLVGSNQGFDVFIDLQHGIRAATINISNLIKTYGTIQGYISAYAPPSENNTQAYINYICAATGLQPTDSPPLDHDTMKQIVMAHFEVENSKAIADQYISDADLEAGLSLTPYGAGLIS